MAHAFNSAPAEPIVSLPPTYAEDVAAVASWIAEISRLPSEQQADQWAGVGRLIAEYEVPSLWNDALAQIAEWNEPDAPAMPEAGSEISSQGVQEAVASAPQQNWVRLASMTPKQLMRQLLHAGLVQVQDSVHRGVVLLENPENGARVKLSLRDESYGNPKIRQKVRQAGLTIQQFRGE